MSAVLVVPAHGRGERFGADKLWADVGGRPLIALTLERAAAAGCFAAVVLAAPEPRWEDLRRVADASGFDEVTLVEGGPRRQDSVAAGLRHCAGYDIVCVHDAARPLAPPTLFAAVVERAEAEGAAIAAVPCVDTIKRVAEGHVVDTVGRSTVMAAQTPQAFRRELLEAAHAAAARDGVDASDDSLLLERSGATVAVVNGDPRNIKVTRTEDLLVLRALLEQR